MRAIALLGVFIVAKLAILTGQPIQISIWTPIAYFWQDILVALTFFILDMAIRRSWIGWTLYGGTVSYVAINVPIARVVSTPLTWPMIGAAGGALSDSIRHHATPVKPRIDVAHYRFRNRPSIAYPPSSSAETDCDYHSRAAFQKASTK